MKLIFLSLVLLIIAIPADSFALSNSTTDPNLQATPIDSNLGGIQQYLPNSATVKDMEHTLIDKVTGGSGTGQVVGESSKNVIDDGINFFSSLKHFVSSLFQFIAPHFLGGNSLPPYFITILTWAMIGLIVYAVLKHAGKILITAAIIGFIIFIIIFGSANFIG